jgi:hypothetical protein
MHKINKKNKLLLVVLCLSTLSIFSQRNIEKGDRYFNVNQFETAIKYYLADASSKSKKTAEYAMQKLADCYRIIGEFEKAEECYRKILKRKKKDPIHYLNYGLSLKSSAKYAEAKIQFQEYIRLKPEDLMGPVYFRSCDSAQKWLDETIGKEVKNIEKINTEYSEFCPHINNSKLYFSSARAGSKQALVSFDGGGEICRLDLYHIDFSNIDKKETDKTDIVNFKEINSSKHEGAACFSKDGRELYFTKTVKGSRNEKTNAILNTLQIFYSKIDSTGKWTVPKSAFSFNSTNYSVAHPSLSADGNTIFFMSDMKGGLGKTDIYFCTKQTNGQWTPPRNIGNSVNTFGYEMFPYIAESGTLYFSSNSHPGMGQLDVFEAHFVEGKWMNVANLKPPINSIGNDFGIVMDGLSHRGFFSSDRFNGKGSEDIYSFADDLPLSLNFKDDSLMFSDKSIFDELKYKITNEKDKSETELVSVSGIYKFKLEKGVSYKLVARKNGMLFNKVFFEYGANQNEYHLEIRTIFKPVLLDGIFSLTKKSPFNEITVFIKDTLGVITKKVVRSFEPINDTIKNNKAYTIYAKFDPTPNMVTNNLAVNLKLKIASHSGKAVENLVITITNGSDTLTSVNSVATGEFSCFLKNIYPNKYNIDISSKEFPTKNIELMLKENSSKEELEVILDEK